MKFLHNGENEKEDRLKAITSIQPDLKFENENEQEDETEIKNDPDPKVESEKEQDDETETDRDDTESESEEKQYERGLRSTIPRQFLLPGTSTTR